ncbi:MAG TPA: LamG domain-containing protein [Polyangiaceae bacterium]|jgi:hypothetical protein
MRAPRPLNMRHVRWLSGLLSLAALGCSNETVVSLLEQPRPPVAPDAAGGADGALPPEAGPPEAGPPDGSPADRRLIHRYSFSGTGTEAVDSISGANGMIINGATLDGAGHLPLDGSDDYVSLPSRLISGLTDATIVAWLDWAGGPCWQRLFEFGSSDTGPNQQGNAVTELFSTPLRCPGTGPTVSYSTLPFSDAVDSNAPFPDPGQYVPITVVFDGTNATMALYVNGTLLGTNALHPLADIDDVTAWLGRSIWPQDVNLHGTYDEFRIYNYPLSEAERIAVEAVGPDTLP